MSAVSSSRNVPRALNVHLPASNEDGQYVIYPDSSSQPPSRAQLTALTALPASMVSRRKRKTNSGKHLARDGAVHSKCYNVMAGRPIPTNGIGLEQAITLEVMLDLASFQSSTTVPSFGGFQFSASQFSGLTTALTVFDQYCFRQIEVWIEPIAAQGSTVFPNFVSAVDLDDANNPTTLGQVSNHQGAIETLGGNGHYHKFVPHIAVASYSGAFTSFTNDVASWIDSASPSVQHYGIKTGLSSSPVSVTYNIIARAVVDLRAPIIA